MELMIVVVIIGILIAIAVPTYGTFAAKAKATSCRATQHTLESGAVVYQAETGSSPSTIADIVGYVGITRSVVCPSGGTYSISGNEVTCSIEGHN